MTLKATEVADAIRAELGRIGEETKGAIEAIRAELARQGEMIGTLEHKQIRSVDEISVAMRRLVGAGGRLEVKGAGALETPEARAFATYLRKGESALEPLERKALTVGDSIRGGFLAPAQLAGDVIRAVKEFSPVRRLARNLETDRGSIDFPRQTAGTAATWVGEVETRTETDAAFGMIEVPLHEMATYIDVSARLLEDAAVNFEDLLAQDLGEAFATAEGAAFAGGNGVKKPFGFLTATAAVPESPSLDGATVKPDGLIKAMYSLKSPYMTNGTWLMNRNTMAVVRQMKDDQLRYLWAEPAGGIVNGQPGTLLGRPVEIDPNLPDIAAGSYPIVFGDWRRGAVVVSKPYGVSIQRDPYTVATSGKVRFHGRMRVGMAVIQPEALVRIKVAAS